MLSAQIQSLLGFLKNLDFEEVHHGDCIGADEEFNIIISNEMIRYGK